MRLSIVIPVFNEVNYLEEVLCRIQSVSLSDIAMEIILVDDCSKDGTEKLLRSWASGLDKGILYHEYSENRRIELKMLKIFFHGKNMGKGAAVKKGFDKATGDIVLVQDADLEYDPKDYSKLLRPILEKKADVVYGSRFIRGKPERIYLTNYLANRFLTKISNLFTGLKLTDIETCYKVFRKEILDQIDIVEKRFGFDPEITAKVGKLKVRVDEVPVSYHGRKNSDGKKIRMRDGLRAVWCIIRYNLFK